MRFFSGSRDLSKKKGAASEAYKAGLKAKDGKAPPPDPMAVYKRQIEIRMAKLMEDILLGKKKLGGNLPGVKQDDKPKEISKSTLQMLRLLAERREQKHRKTERKREIKFQRDEKAKKALLKQEELMKEQLVQQKAAEYYAEQQAKTHSYLSNETENKSGWW